MRVIHARNVSEMCGFHLYHELHGSASCPRLVSGRLVGSVGSGQSANDIALVITGGVTAGGKHYTHCRSVIPLGGDTIQLRIQSSLT